MWPNLNGATTVVRSFARSPPLGLFYVAVRETGATYFKREADYKPGTFFAGGEASARVAAGRRLWRHSFNFKEATSGKMITGVQAEFAAVVGRALTPAGAWCSAGPREGNFFALDAKTAKPVWDFSGGRGNRRESEFVFDPGDQQHVFGGRRIEMLYVFGL